MCFEKIPEPVTLWNSESKKDGEEPTNTYYCAFSLVIVSLCDDLSSNTKSERK